MGKGIDRTAIVINSKGKASPAANNSTVYGRQLNRRVEFLLKGNSIQYSPKYTTYIVKPQTTLFSLSRAFNITVDEIKRLNGYATNNALKAYAPVRLPIVPDNRVPSHLVFDKQVLTGKGYTLYKVKRGDTIESLAEKFSLPEELLIEVNGLYDAQLKVGQTINIYRLKN